VAKDIKTGDEITKDMVQTVEVGGYNLPQNVISKKDTVVGSYALADMSVGDYILNTKVSKTPAAENAYLYNLDGSRQAVSITIKSFANGLSGKLKSGDIVSVIAPDYKKQGIALIPPELKYVEVISVTASSGYDANTGEQKEKSKADERELPSTVTLLVTPEQGNILAGLEADGGIHLSLVYRGAPENSKKFIDMQTNILEELYPKEKDVSEKSVDEAQITKDKEEAGVENASENSNVVSENSISSKED